jgi:mannosylglucosylglycerate synthase
VRYVAISELRRLEVAQATGLPPDEVTVIPNGLDVEAFLGLHPATRRMLAPLHLGGADPIVLIPARITPRKNLELGIAVLAELSPGQRRPPDRHRAPGSPRPAGRGASRPAPGPRAGTRRGRRRPLPGGGPGRQTPPRVVADLYRLADVLLLPSTDEGFGLPILEAAVCRLPIVCADIGPLRDLAGEDASYIDPAADPADVARIIRDVVMATSPTRLAARVRTAYGWAAIYDRRIEPLLAEVTGTTPAFAGSGGPRLS